ncbi:MAG: HU family DNA-binding protein [Ignavibacteria bacterium]|nr:HU family DNA-binding protein [Ignavibacteria bacterium]
MDNESLISVISIEFGLSREQSEIIVNSIFRAVAQSLRKNTDLEIQKFGKFKLIPDKDTKKECY